jgi:hypothetical protein
MVMRDVVTPEERITFPDRSTVYGIHCNDSILFLTLEAAEDYLIDNYPEHCSCKDAAYDFCEQMIWEDSKSSLLNEVT